MANNRYRKQQLLQSYLSLLVIFFSLMIILELASARPGVSISTTELEAAINSTAPDRMESKNELVKNEFKAAAAISNRKQVGLGFGPTLMHMLPKGRIPASGPSRRINNANN